jgi:gamma-glutamyl-gamma-aminobutyrate hydrolase PuuD
MTGRLSVGVTQRVIWDGSERRDALDQAWTASLEAEGAAVIPLGNALEDPLALLDDLAVDAVVLTGGNSLASTGEDDVAPDRDRFETAVLAWARPRQVPVLGICRGMQVIATEMGSPLVAISGHVATEHPIQWRIDVDLPAVVNSFHHFGIRAVNSQVEALAMAGDGSLEALRHRSLPWAGVMWHPERLPEYPCGPLALLDRLLAR